LALGLSAGLAPPAAAQSAGLSMTVSSAFGGNFKYGEWLPVLVELENRGGDLNAEVRVQVASSQGAVIFSAPVELPSSSRKLVTVYTLPNNFSRELEVRLVDSSGAELLAEKASVRPQPNITYMAGLLTPERGALALISAVELPGQERPKTIVDLSLAELPEKGEGLRSFDLLVLNDFDTARLTPEQSDALATWVQRGGQLVIGGGPGAQRTLAGLPEEMLPVRVTGPVEVDLDDLRSLAALAGAPLPVGGPYVAARAEVVEGHVLAGNDDLPLIVVRSYGVGQVHFNALDLTGTPYNGWPGTQTLWEALIGPAGRYPENMPFDMSPRQYRANSLFYSLTNIPSLDLPSIRGLSILLGFYILVVGPVNYLFLRWRKRLHLAWVTIPVLTVLFAAGAFGIGYAMRGNDLVLNKIAIIPAQPPTGAGRAGAPVTTYLGLFSPRQQSYEVLVEGQGLISPMTGYDPNPWGGSGIVTGGQMVFEQGQPARVQGLTVNQWSMQSFMSEGTWADFGSLTGDLYLEHEVLKGTLRNETSYPLSDVVLTLHNRFVRLGDMAAGEEKTIDLGLANLQGDRFGPPLGYLIYQDSATGVMSREGELKSNIVSTIFDNMPGMRDMLSSRMPVGSNSTEGVFVLAWLDQAPPNVSVPGSGLSQQATALVYTNLNYSLPETGLLELPPGLMPGIITELPREGGACGGDTSVYMGRGQAEFEFRVPENLDDLTVTALKVSIWRDTGQLGMPDISLYDWTNQSWTSIQEPIQGTNIIQNAAPYVSQEGLVRVMLTSEQDSFGCVFVDLGLEGERLGGSGQGG